MSRSHFSKQELYNLRNHIPVAEVMNQLDIPVKISEGYTRFLCPVCKEFNTSINPKTNLARCFLCEKNYNPIDLVLSVKGLTFIESVKYLRALNDNRQTDTTAISGKLSKSSHSLVSIKEIINSPGMLVKQTSEQSEQLPGSQIHKEMHTKISLLEQQIKILTAKISLIEQQLSK